VKTLYLLAIITTLYVSGCSDNLNESKASIAIDKWIEAKYKSFPLDDFNSPQSCIQPLLQGGYITHSGRTQLGFKYKSTGGIVVLHNVNETEYLTLFKGVRTGPIKILQIEGDKLAKITFKYKYVPVSAAVPDSCRKHRQLMSGAPEHEIEETAMFLLTTNGWSMVNRPEF